MSVSIIPIREHRGKQAASLRDLHEFLGVSERFTDWAARMFEYGFTENEDYAEVYPDSRNNPTGGRPRKDWAITLDMGKEISMIQRTERGKQARQYFIEAEKRAHSEAVLPRTLPEALRQYANEVEAHETTRALVAVLEPKADAWNDLVSSSGSLSFRDAAKVISEEGGVNISGPRLIETLLAWRWVFRPPSTPEEKAKKKVRTIRAYQTQIDAGTLTEKAKTYTDQNTGEKKLSNNPQTRVTGKGLDAIRTRLLQKEIAA